MQNTLLTPKQAAEKLNVSTRTLRRWKNAGLVSPVATPTGKIAYQHHDVIKLKDRKFAPLPNNSEPLRNEVTPPPTTPTNVPPHSFQMPLPPQSSPFSDVVTSTEPITPPQPVPQQLPPASYEAAAPQPMPFNAEEFNTPTAPIAPEETTFFGVEPTTPDQSTDSNPPSSETANTQTTSNAPPTRKRKEAMAYASIFLILLLLIGGGIVLANIISPKNSADVRSQASPGEFETNEPTGQFPTSAGDDDIGSFLGGKITIGTDTGELAFIDDTGNIYINGNATIDGALHLAPQNPPTNPKAGDQYFDATQRTMLYYDGINWIDLNQSSDSENITIGSLQAAYENGGSIDTIAGDLTVTLTENSDGDGNFIIRLEGNNSEFSIEGGADQELITINDNATYPIDISQATRILGNLYTPKLIDSDGNTYFVDPAALSTSANFAGSLSLGNSLTFSLNGDSLSNSSNGYITSSAGFSVGGDDDYYFNETGHIHAYSQTIDNALDVNGQVDLGDGDNSVSIYGNSLSLSSTSGIDFKPSNDSNDYIYLTTTSDSPTINFEGISSTNDPGIRTNSSTGQIEYRDEDSATWVSLDSLGDVSTILTDASGIVYLTDVGQDFAVGSSSLTAPFSVDESTNTVRIGEGSGSNGTLSLYASDGDTGSLSYTTNDTFSFGGGNVVINDNLSVTGTTTLSSVASVTDNNQVLTVDSGEIKYIDTSNWDKDTSDDLSSWLLGDDDGDSYDISGGNLIRFTSSDGNVLTNLINGDDADENLDLTVRRLGDIVAGNGLTGDINDIITGADTDDVSLAIGAGNGITVNSDDVAVNQAYGFGWSGLHSYSNNSYGFTHATSITLDATGDFIIDADGGDVSFADGGSNFATFTNSSGNLVLNSGGSIDLQDAVTVDSLSADTGDLNATLGALQTAGTTRISNTGALQNISTTQLNGVTYTWPGADAAGSGYALTSNGSGTLSWTAVLADTPSVGAWSHGTHFIYPDEYWADDLIIGGNSTASATFQVTAGSGNVSTDGTLSVAGTSNLQGDVSDSAGDFTIADNAVITGTSDLRGAVANSTGNLSLNDNTDVTGDLTTTGNTDVGGTFTSGTGNAFQIDGSGNLVSSGTTGITLSGSGADLAFTGGGNNLISSTGTLQLGALTLTGAVTGGNQTITDINTLTFGTGNLSLTGATIGLTSDTDLVSLADNALTVNGTITATGNINSSGGSLLTNGTARISNTGALQNISTTQLNGVTYTWPGADGNSGQVLSTNSSGTLSWASVLTDSPSVGAWSHGTHFIYPDEYWADDLIIGGNSTASAKFQVFGTTGNITTDGTLQVLGTSDLQGDVSDSAGDFTIADNAVVTGTSDLRGAVANSTGNLVLGDTTDIGSGTTGLRIDSTGLLIDIDGNVVIGDTVDLGSASTGINITTAGVISDIDGNISLNDNTDVTGDLTTTGNTDVGGTFTSGTGNAFQIDGSGRLVNIDGVAHTIEDVSGDLRLSSNSTTISLNDNVTFGGSTTLNGQTYSWPNSSGTDGYVLTTNGAGSLSWTSVLSDSPSVGAWSHGTHFIYPDEYWADDLIIGGNSTASATFQVTAGSGNVSTDGTLSVAGTSNLQGDVSDSAGDFTIADNAVITGTSDLRGAVANSTGNLSLNDNTDVTGDLTTTGNTDVGGTFTSGTGNAFQIDGSGNLVSSGTTGITLSGSGADLAFTGGGNNLISSTGTLQLGALTLTGAVTGGNQTITDINTLTFGTGNLSLTGATIGLTSDTDLVSLADNALTVNGTITATGNINSSGGSLLTNGTARISNTGALQNISTTQLNGVTYTWPGADGNSGQVLSTNSSGTLSWASVLTDSPSVGAWSHGTHFIYPDEYWADDLIIGGNSTASAKFQVFGTTGNITTDGTLQVLGTSDLQGNISNSTGTLTLDDTTSVTGTLGVSGALTLSTIASVSDNNVVLTSDSGIVKYIDSSAWDKNGADDYTGWTISDGVSSENIASGNTVSFLDGNSMSVSYNTTTNEVTIDTIQDIRTTASPLFAGGTFGNVSIGIANDNTISSITGNTIIDSNAGLIVLKDNLSAEGAATISGNLVVLGTSNLQGDVSDSAGDFTIADNAVITGTSDLRGAVANSTGNLSLNDNTDVTGDLTTTGNTDVGGTFTSGTGNAFQIDGSGRLVNIDGVAHTIEDVSGDLRLSSNSTTVSVNDGLTVSGTITANGGALTRDSGNLTLSTTTSGNLVLTSAGNITFTGFDCTGNTNGGVLTANASGVISCSDDDSGSASFWDIANGALYTINNTTDLLVGGDATSSAKFAVLNVNSGTPTASISAGLTGAAYLTADGYLQTTNDQMLTIGGNTTGAITLDENTSITKHAAIGPDASINYSPNASTANTVLSLANENFDLTADSNMGIYNYLSLNPTSPGGYAYGTYNQMVTDPTNTTNIDGVSGLSSYFYHQADSTVNEAYGLDLYVTKDDINSIINNAIGINIYTQGDQNVTGIIGNITKSTDSTVAGDTFGALYQIQNLSQVSSGTDTTYGSNISIGRSGATGGTINTYGSFIEVGGDNAGAGAHTAYGVYVNMFAGPDTSYAGIFNGGNVGIGDTSPISPLTVGNGDLFQVNSSGIISAIDGVAHTIDDVSGNLTLTSNSTAVSIADGLIVSGSITANGGSVTRDSGNLAISTTTSGNLTLTSAGSLIFTGFNCTGNTNGGALTADASGVISCSDDDGGASDWTHGNHFIAPSHYWADDLIIGGNSTASAKFQVFGTTGNITTDGTLQVLGTSDLQGDVSDSAGDFTIADNAVITGTSDLRGAVANSTGNLVLGDTTDIGSGTTGLRIDSTGLLIDIDGNVVIGDTVDLGSASTGINITTAGVISDSDANVVIADNIDLGSASTGLNITTGGVISDNDGSILVADHITPNTNDTYDLGSTSNRFRDVYIGPDNTFHIGTSTTDEGTIGYNTSTNILNIGTDSTTNGDIAFFTDDLYLDKSSANIGIGTTAPDAALEINHATGDNLRLTYNDSNGSAANYTDFSLSSSGDLTLDSSGNDIILASGDNLTLTSGNLIQTSPATTGTAYTLTADTINSGTGIDLSIDGLTSGKGLNITSTSTVMTSGILTSLDWSPTGSTQIYGTGDLLRLNIGQYGNLTNLLNITDNGSTIFSVSENVITSAVPHAFTAAGDVSMANDLVFTNQTSASIQSYGPLAIQAGEAFESNNLTLTTYNAGNIILDVATGGVGIGSSITPISLLEVNGAKTGKALAIFNETGNQDILTASASGTTRFRVATDGYAYANRFVDLSNSSYYLDPASSSTALTLAGAAGVGGVTSPDRTLEVLDASNPQLRLTQADASVYADFQVNSSGDLIIGVDGTSNQLVLDNGGNVGFGTAGPDRKVDILDASNPQLRLSQTDGTTYADLQVDSNGDFILGVDGSSNQLVLDNSGKIGIGHAAPVGLLDVNGRVTGKALVILNETGNQDILTASASGTTRFRIGNDGYTYAQRFADIANTTYYLDPAAATSLFVSGDIVSDGAFTLDSNGNNNITIDAGSATVMIGATGTGKLDAGTIDPPYTINGQKYATYLSSMIGVKEEHAGTINTTVYVPGVGYRQSIDFKQQTNGSDLWLFAETTDLRKNIDKLSVLLSPAGNTRAWYELNTRDYILNIYTTTPSVVSYRLTAPRFDAEEWTNTRDSSSIGFVINTDGWMTNPEGIIIGQNQSLENIAITLSQESDYTLTDLTGQLIENVSAYSKAIIANLQAGFIAAQEITTNSLQADLISPLSGDAIVIDGNLNITGTLTATNLESPEIDQIEAAVINNGQTIASQSGRIAALETIAAKQIATAEQESVRLDALTASIASLSGQVANLSSSTNNNGELPEPTVEGQNVKNNWDDPFISDLKDQYASLSALIAAGTFTYDQATPSADISSVYLESMTLSQLSASTLFVPDQALIDTLSVGQAAVFGNDLLINSQAIQTIASDTLYLQPTGGNLNLVAGLMTLSGDGNRVTINGDVEITGKLVADNLESNEVKVRGAITANTLKNEFGQLLDVKLATNSALAIYQDLDATASASITASGSARFRQLALPETSGSTSIVAGEQEATISVPNLSTQAQVFITFNNDYAPATKYWVTTDPIESTFTLHLNYPVAETTTVSWFVLN